VHDAEHDHLTARYCVENKIRIAHQRNPADALLDLSTLNSKRRAAAGFVAAKWGRIASNSARASLE
jgi:hypothetical protein